jgi:hypothetical protein
MRDVPREFGRLRPKVACIIAGIASFPIVLFGYLAIAADPGNLWPIAMVIHGMIAALPFGLGYGIGLLIKVVIRK